jgi:hypothetical protein
LTKAVAGDIGFAVLKVCYTFVLFFQIQDARRNWIFCRPDRPIRTLSDLMENNVWSQVRFQVRHEHNTDLAWRYHVSQEALPIALHIALVIISSSTMVRHTSLVVMVGLIADRVACTMSPSIEGVRLKVWGFIVNAESMKGWFGGRCTLQYHLYGVGSELQASYTIACK